MKVLLYISFLGTNYCGYQIQPNGITVQQKLNEAAKTLFGYDCDIVGCSRTDSGVHANCFCATVSKKGCSYLDATIPVTKIPIAMSNLLPNDIAVFDAKAVDDDFHARYDVKYKEYIYKIWNRAEKDPFWYDRSYHYPKTIDDESLARMDEAAKHFIGKHDFSAYMKADTDVATSVRTVYDAQVIRDGDMIEFCVSADGFLYNMVRIFVGTLIAVAEDKIAPDQIEEITLSKDRKNAGMTAPPQGLFLNKVVY